MSQRAHAIPLLRSNEEQLTKMSRRLEEVFNNLNLIHDLMVVCAHAIRGGEDCSSEAGRCLELIAGNRLYGQLRVLTNIIERLGGTTDFTEEQSTPPAPQSSSGNETEAGSPGDGPPP